MLPGTTYLVNHQVITPGNYYQAPYQLRCLVDLPGEISENSLIMSLPDNSYLVTIIQNSSSQSASLVSAAGGMSSCTTSSSSSSSSPQYFSTSASSQNFS